MTSADARLPDLSAAVQAALQRGDAKGALALVLEAERAAPAVSCSSRPPFQNAPAGTAIVSAMP